MDLSATFSGQYRVRFDEAAADGRVRASTLVRYLQDLAWRHSEAAGFDRGWYATRGMGWLVRGLELTLLGSAGYGETLTVTTRILGWRRMWARRFSEILATDGAMIARAWIDWVLLDATGRPIRIPAEMEAFVSDAEPFIPTRIDLVAAPPPRTTVVRSTIRSADVDPMGHLNNAGYLDLLDELVRAAADRGLAAPASVRLQYLQPALPGMAVDGYAWEAGPGLACLLRASGTSVDLLRATVT